MHIPNLYPDDEEVQQPAIPHGFPIATTEEHSVPMLFEMEVEETEEDRARVLDLQHDASDAYEALEASLNLPVSRIYLPNGISWERQPCGCVVIRETIPEPALYVRSCTGGTTATSGRNALQEWDCKKGLENFLGFSW